MNLAIHTNVVISANDTLTIAAGTVITGDNRTNSHILIIQGALIANGNQALPVLFTSGSWRNTNSAQGDRCLEIPSSTNTSLNWITFENCDIGFTSFTTNYLAVSNCTFRLCNEGAYIQGQNSHFFSCNFQSNGFPAAPKEGTGAMCWGGSPTFQNCVKTLRFWNQQMRDELEAVRFEIWQALMERTGSRNITQQYEHIYFPNSRRHSRGRTRHAAASHY